MSDQRTVRVATCSGAAEVAVIRSALEAHDIHPIIPGEVVSTLGPHLTACSIPVFVAADDAEEAEKLISEIRAQAPVEEEPEEDGEEDALAPGAEDVAVTVDRRARTGVTLLFALCLGFGTGHMSTGAWKRGIALAAVEIIGIRHSVAGSRWGAALVALAVVVDLVGSLRRVRARNARVPLPTATLKRR